MIWFNWRFNAFGGIKVYYAVKDENNNNKTTTKEQQRIYDNDNKSRTSTNLLLLLLNSHHKFQFWFWFLQFLSCYSTNKSALRCLNFCFISPRIYLSALSSWWAIINFSNIITIIVDNKANEFELNGFVIDCYLKIEIAGCFWSLNQL